MLHYLHVYIISVVERPMFVMSKTTVGGLIHLTFVTVLLAW